MDSEVPAREQHRVVPRTTWLWLLVLVCAIMLFAGLRPYASFSENWVEFDESASVTRFKGYGLAVGDLHPDVGEAAAKQDLQIALKLTPGNAEDTNFRILAQIDSPGSTDPLIMGQWRSSLISINSRDYRNEHGLPRVSANLEAHIDTPVDVVISFGTEESRVEVNGKFSSSGDAFSFETPPTRISIGNAPDGHKGWIGALSSFSLGRIGSELPGDRFAFESDRLPVVENDSREDSSLTVPKPGRFPDRAFIDTMELDQLLTQNLRDVVINFLGFSPFGFVLCAVLLAGERPMVRSGLTAFFITLAAGALFSFAIEFSQTWIPGRNPHAHDLILNTLGTIPGSIGYLILAALTGWIIAFRNRPPAADLTDSPDISLD